MQEFFKNLTEDEIVSIEITDEFIDMLDVSIDSDDELFIANGILTHNSAYSNSDVSLSSIAESAALIHTVDGLFGIIQDEILYMNSEYYVKVLCLRDSGYKDVKKKFNVSYDYMRITEDVNSQIIESQY